MKIRVAIITVSDRCSRNERDDLTGPALKDAAVEKGCDVVLYKVVPDEVSSLASLITKISDDSLADLVLTAGGTGLSERDITPEATKSVISKEVPGISEMIRAESAKITGRAYLSRGMSGIRRRTLIINLPGSPKGATESFNIVSPIIDHAVEVLRGTVSDCGRK